MTGSDPRQRRVVMGLSARLLVLTVVFVMIAEFLIYAPSISRFRKVYLEETVARAHLATLALEATPDAMLSEELKNELLFHAGAYAVVLNRPDRRTLALSRDMPPKVDVTFKLGPRSAVMWLTEAFAALVQDGNRVMRVMGPSPKDPEVMVEVVLDETPMRLAMYGYSARILQLSIVISLLTAGLVYLSLHWLLVRPMRRITENMTAFQEDPEDEARTIVPGGRTDEIGVAERQLAIMERDVRAALQQKSRLATLGAAVAKINHDLRNSLATAMLVSDRLADIDDPEVQRVTPRLFSAIDYAVTLCSQTLNYVGDGLPKVEKRRLDLHDLVAAVQTEIDSPDTDAAEAPRRLIWNNAVAPGTEVEADRKQVIRVLANLARNAAEAGAGTLRISASGTAERLLLDVADDGPGLPPKALEKLFQPFAGSVRAGGTGLGLVIARDILRAHGGDIALVRSDETGTTFRLEVPANR